MSSARFRPAPPSQPPTARTARRRYLPKTTSSPAAIPGPPWTPTIVLQHFSSRLTRYERTEICNFPEIYFLGVPGKKTDRIRFDNRNHHYKVVVGDHLAYRYQIVRTFGKGSFGQVLECFDHKTQLSIAVKVIINTPQMQQQGQIEAQLLASLGDLNSEVIVKAHDFFTFRSHVCITFEILGKNLYQLVQHNRFRPFPVAVCRGYAQQLLTALHDCQRCQIVHCDLKPENILIWPDDYERVKLVDFGSGCFLGHQQYEYIQSRFYRAPEVILALGYGSPMDMWSMALVITELLMGKPLLTGTDEVDQLAAIAELLGSPPIGMIERSKRRRELFDEHGRVRVRKGRRRNPGSISLASVLKVPDPQLHDFIKRCLTWDPDERLTASEGLSHPFITAKTFTIQRPPRPIPGLLPPILV
jgi:dual specificity tyrosine-phosphorylation-regulated kinase 2/3/4